MYKLGLLPDEEDMDGVSPQETNETSLLTRVLIDLFQPAEMDTILKGISLDDNLRVSLPKREQSQSALQYFTALTKVLNTTPLGRSVEFWAALKESRPKKQHEIAAVELRF